MNSVKLCVHRAADIIGGNCIEIVAPSGERCILDAGRPLETPDNEPTPMPQSLSTDCPPLGVLLSHTHLDHYGLLDMLPDSWPIYCGEASKRLLSLYCKKKFEYIDQSCKIWKHKETFNLGPFAVTPYLVDHSAFDAYALEIVVAGKRIFYSGDFRTHGRKGGLTEQLISSPPNYVDVLLMEGTSLAADTNREYQQKSESDLEDEFVELFKKTKGRVFVSWASSNVDRTVTLFRACKRSGRIFVPDLYCMLILTLLKNFSKGIPQPEWESNSMCAVVTSRMMSYVNGLCKEDFVKYLKEFHAAMGAKWLAEKRDKWVIMARDKLLEDFKNKGVVPDENDAWVWSMWKGYLDDESSNTIKGYFAPCKMEHIHCSGHASPESLLKFAKAVSPRMLIPVHGKAIEMQNRNFPNLRIAQDGEWIDI
jgi:ribonuclease J